MDMSCLICKISSNSTISAECLVVIFGAVFSTVQEPNQIKDLVSGKTLQQKKNLHWTTNIPQIEARTCISTKDAFLFRLSSLGRLGYTEKAFP